VLLEAVELLGQLGNEEAVPALEAVAAHGDASQRGEALDALARIGGARARGIVERVERVTTDEDEREHVADLLETWL
jgi:HEAT repeat protein